jgi:DNA-binding MarR family transcriptional regulator
MSEKPPKRTTKRAVPPSRRRSGGVRGKLLDPGSDSRPTLPRKPARVRLDRPARATAAAAIGWPHMLVNGSDAEFRRMMRRLTVVMHRLREIQALAARAVGISGAALEMLFAIVEADIDGGDADDESGDGSVALSEMSRRLSIGRANASELTDRLQRAGMLVKRPDPAYPSRRRVAATSAGRRAASEAAPLIRAAHNVAFAGLDARAFERLCRMATRLETGSAVAVDTLARRTGEELDGSIRELRRTARRLGLK